MYSCGRKKTKEQVEYVKKRTGPSPDSKKPNKPKTRRK